MSARFLSGVMLCAGAAIMAGVHLKYRADLDTALRHYRSVQQGVADPSLPYSETRSLSVLDDDRPWTLWAGNSNAAYWNRSDVRSAQYFALLGYASAALGTLGLWAGVFLVAVRQKALRRSEERFRSLVQNASEVTLILNRAGGLQYVSEAAERIWGYSVEWLMAHDLFALIDADDAVRIRPLFQQICHHPNATITAELRLRRSDGSWRHFEVIMANRLTDEALNGVVYTFRDVTENKVYEAQLAHQAFYDPLTGLSNRVFFLDALQRAFLQAKRQEAPIGVLFLDLDNFKIINDSLGHEAGDQLLVTVAERLRECAQSSSMIARLGGDEFTILLENVPDVHEVTQMAERIVESLQCPILLQGREVFASCSIGIAFSKEFSRKPNSLLRDADTAMYQAKTNGKARFVLFDRSMNDRVLERLELEADLRGALARNELRLYYQPIIRLATGQICEMEALMRWQHPQRGLVPPGKFISIAEEIGLISAIGQWALEEACRQTKRWQGLYPGKTPLTVGVNLSARQLQQEEIIASVKRILQETGLAPSCLKLEITESLMLFDMEKTIERLQELRALGVRLALDDFGTGYSSMSYLSRLPVDTLKIDRSFIDRLGSDAEADAIVRAIITLAKTLNLCVTSEGIETSSQLARLAALGCDLGQGYYFSPPLASDSYETLLASGQSFLLEKVAETVPRARFKKAA